MFQHCSVFHMNTFHDEVELHFYFIYLFILVKAQWIEGKNYIQIGLIPGCTEHIFVLRVLC